MKKDYVYVDTLIISDLHLGFKQSRAVLLLEVLNKYRFKKLILNGDIFDDMNFSRFGSEHWDIVSYVRHISKFAEVVWIIGNHDGKATFLSKLLGVKIYSSYEWNEGRVKCLAIHGHQYDRFISKNIFISNLAGSIYYWLKSLAHKNWFVTNLIKKYSRSWLRMSDEVAAGAIALARRKGVHLVFCGHTHLPVRLVSEKITYFNSGSWVENPSTLITIIKGKAELVNFE